MSKQCIRVHIYNSLDYWDQEVFVQIGVGFLPRAGDVIHLSARHIYLLKENMELSRANTVFYNYGGIGPLEDYCFVCAVAHKWNATSEEYICSVSLTDDLDEGETVINL